LTLSVVRQWKYKERVLRWGAALASAIVKLSILLLFMASLCCRGDTTHAHESKESSTNFYDLSNSLLAISLLVTALSAHTITQKYQLANVIFTRDVDEAHGLLKQLISEEGYL
jgi:hypothetical protein